MHDAGPNTHIDKQWILRTLGHVVLSCDAYEVSPRASVQLAPRWHSWTFRSPKNALTTWARTLRRPYGPPDAADATKRRQVQHTGFGTSRGTAGGKGPGSPDRLVGTVGLDRHDHGVCSEHPRKRYRFKRPRQDRGIRRTSDPGLLVQPPLESLGRLSTPADNAKAP